MATIVKGTTPTLKYTFKTVNVANLTSAFLTVKQMNRVIIEKDLSSATVGEGFISWTFSQRESLQLTRGKVTARLNWKTVDGTRGVSSREVIFVEDNEKNEVI